MDYPKTYTDANNRKWTVDISTAALKRMWSMAQFRLDSVFPEAGQEDPKSAINTYQAFLDNDILVSEVLYAILKPECDKAGVSQEQFDDGLRNEFNVAAIMALHQAITDFSHPSRKAFLRGVTMSMQKQEKALASGLKRMNLEAEKLTDEKIDDVVNKHADELLKKSASGLLGISA